MEQAEQVHPTIDLGGANNDVVVTVQTQGGGREGEKETQELQNDVVTVQTQGGGRGSEKETQELQRERGVITGYTSCSRAPCKTELHISADRWASYKTAAQPASWEQTLRGDAVFFWVMRCSYDAPDPGELQSR
ncbi:hypothetical protein NQZ68_028165 [Dissostichus eleginoides]|nr:hypothetical protein NQZ68_028165 [Dissostichus eleginoides]